jgi:hypothetical protein
MYVWSAAWLQAKNEGDDMWSTQMYPALFEQESSRASMGMRRAPVLPTLTALKGMLTTTGFESAGFDHFAISKFASRPGRCFFNRF